MKGMPDKSVDLIVTDPPYGIAYKTNHRKYKNDFCTEIENDKTLSVFQVSLPEMARILKDDTAIYVFASPTMDSEVEFLIGCQFTDIKNKIIWVKNNWTAGDLKCSFGRQYESLFLANKGKCEIKGKRYPDVWNIDRVAGEKQYHQNQKPIPLIQRCITSHSNPGDLILDPFMGSGTTCVAAKMLGRKYIGIELEQKYIDIAQARLDGVNQDLFIDIT
jgi:site-specific DNA-methyltransferase (adenine-specific)